MTTKVDNWFYKYSKPAVEAYQDEDAARALGYKLESKVVVIHGLEVHWIQHEAHCTCMFDACSRHRATLHGWVPQLESFVHSG